MADKNIFIEWLRNEMTARDMSQSDLARAANVSRAAISGIMTGARGPGEDICNGIADAFHLPPEEVFAAAGLLKPQKGRDERAERLLYQIEQLDEDDQETIATLVGALIEKRNKKVSSPRTATN